MMIALTHLHWAGAAACITFILVWLFLRKKPRQMIVSFEPQSGFGFKCPVPCLGCGARLIVFVPHAPDPQKMFGRQVVAEHKCHACEMRLYTMTGMTGRSTLSKGIEFQGNRIVLIQAVEIVPQKKVVLGEDGPKPTVLSVSEGADGKPCLLRPG